MNEVKVSLSLLKEFFKYFNIRYEKGFYDNILSLNKKKNINLCINNKIVGSLMYDGKNYTFITNNLKGRTYRVIENGKMEMTIEYNISKNNKNIIGKTIISSDKINTNLNMYDCGNLESSYFVSSEYNEVIISNKKKNEAIDFNNMHLKHRDKNGFTNITYDLKNDFLTYYRVNKEFEDILAVAGGYNLFVDDNKKDLLKINENYRLNIDELDPGYMAFIKEEKENLEYFYRNFFDNIIYVTLHKLSNKQKGYIFNEGYGKSLQKISNL